MTEAVPETAREAVELTYEPVLADAVGAIRARARATPAGRLQNGVLVVCGLFALGALFLNLTASAGPRVGGTVFCLALLVMLIGMHRVLPGLQGQQVHRLYATQPEFRVVVDADGVRQYSRDLDMTYRWGALPRYTETDDLFVLLSGDRHGVGIAFLPKRGISDPGGTDRLRAILDRNITRL
ncbi:YcxB family protein [Streptomyces sp. WAC05374]|uniref:YcxB family protein n=1 Tax=Streptomyces sp. WAC05374 TaxID=2487420 RepID=UPI000F86CC1D|nr:YcxB family protein [Streptomyces sp. WAC05374]RST15187.1 YcxB family protein [Streptomyces sp. WAC05374]TDF45277.1 YcxB family protein [Streptomyces sp. WAC05374]TDF55735.1 YcxB family protein [Streptomyces sp. WAC05374]TDF58873.1 YcxB family protein [Streptomyces sp. WAC05374]